MSRDARSWVRSRSPLTGGEYAVHLTMADTVDDGCVFWMDQPTLAAHARVSRRTTARAVARMLALGLLERVDTPEQEKMRRASHQAIRLRMTFPDLREVAPPCHDVVSSQDDADISPSHHGVSASESPCRDDVAVAISPCHGDAATLDPPCHHDAAKEQELEKQQDLAVQQELPPAPLPSILPVAAPVADVLPSEDGEGGTLFPQPPPSLRLVKPPKPASSCAVAKLILNDWWERQDPKPQQKYVAFLGVMTTALESGWEERDLAEALDSVPTMSGPALDFWRNTRKTKKRPQYGTGSRSAEQIADAAVEELADLMGYNR